LYIVNEYAESIFIKYIFPFASLRLCGKKKDFIMYSISKLAAEFGLSRSTLLYYDSLGLLKPSGRTDARYRQYSEEDRKKLEQICAYREMGIPLNDIKKILSSKGNSVKDILENQLMLLSKEISSLRKQQFAILSILKNRKLQNKAGLMNKDEWTNLLRSAGLDDEGMKKWHIEFERMSPKAHHDFLVSLGIDEEYIRQIRGWIKH
jgi:DNA-binding transcriptional MerR regulator